MTHLRQLAFLSLSLAAALACSEPSPSPSPTTTLPQLYRYSPNGGGHQLTLYRADTRVELRAHELGEDDGFIGLAEGTLSADAAEELDAWLDALLAGEQELGELHEGPVDSPIVELWVGDYRFSYATNYPPTGLTELDALAWAILDDLSQCRPSASLTPSPDCEVLAEYPE